jgi:serine/threonine protein kinase/Tol biopolymer transport system component
MIGQKIAHYEIKGSLGKGGMGEVWRAHDTTLDRDVAIKLLPESFVGDANRVARFEQEARTLAALNHPNIAQIYGLEPAAAATGEAGTRSTALVMELVEGPTLADRIEQGPIPVDEALNIALQIASALEAAHGQGIVHRDLKPANIKLRPDGTVKVLDFGIAKSIEMRATSGGQPAMLTTPSMTEAGVVLGTAAYMSPEQARGKPVDKRADIWAFGCLLYEMLTGQGAFIGEDVTTTLARVIEREPDLVALPKQLSPTIHGTLALCLQKDPDRRLHDIGDVRLALGGGLAALSATADAADSRAPLWRRMLPSAAALIAGVVIAAAYFSSDVEPAPTAPVVESPPRGLTRFTITPPDDTPLASLGGYDVTISPDGRRIAYFAQDLQRGSVELYVRDLDALEGRVVPGTEVTNTSGGNMNPFFSPDGRSIGFFTPDRGVVRVSIDGAPPTKILDPPTPAFLGASWADDNTLIYSPGRSIQRVATAGSGTPEPLSADFDIDTYVASPVLLPGGDAVLFGEIVDGIESVAVLDLTSGESKTLIDGAQNATYSPTGHIVYARGTTLMAAPFDASELSVTGESVAMVQNVRHPNSLTAADYALSDNGTLVYVPSSGEAGGLSDIVWVDRNGGTAGEPVATNLASPRDPQLSPDGRQLLVTLGPNGDGDLWRYDLGGRPPVPLALNSDSRFGVWSPDGRRIAYVQVGGSDNGADVKIIAADGSELTPQPLRADGLVAGPVAWLPGDELILIQNPSSPDVLVTPVAPDGEVETILGSEFLEFDPALSPDGRWLAYVSDRSGTPEVWVQAYPRGAPIRVSSTGGWEPQWSADGSELYFLQGNTVWASAVDLSGGFSFEPPVALFTRPFSTMIASNVRSWDVADDGRFLMIQAVGSEFASSGSESIVVVENWAEELSRRVPTGQ